MYTAIKMCWSDKQAVDCGVASWGWLRVEDLTGVTGMVVVVRLSH